MLEAIAALRDVFESRGLPVPSCIEFAGEEDWARVYRVLDYDLRAISYGVEQALPVGGRITVMGVEVREKPNT